MSNTYTAGDSKTWLGSKNKAEPGDWIVIVDGSVTRSGAGLCWIRTDTGFDGPHLVARDRHGCWGLTGEPCRED